jgi:hypothetical protein
MANKLYNEHYTVVPTKHQISKMKAQAKVNFEWLPIKKNGIAFYVEVVPRIGSDEDESLEQFIYEHYYGYTKNSR